MSEPFRYIVVATPCRHGNMSRVIPDVYGFVYEDEAMVFAKEVAVSTRKIAKALDAVPGTVQFLDTHNPDCFEEAESLYAGELVESKPRLYEVKDD